MKASARPELSDTAALNPLELTSVRALLCYVAHEQKVSEDLIKTALATRFGVTEVTELPRQSYDDVIRFLVDIQVEMLLN